MAQIARDIGYHGGGSNLARVLRNPIYKGIRRIDRKTENGVRRARRSDEIIEVRVIDDPLVSAEEWAETQRRLQSRPRPHQRTESERPHVYLGLAKCANCGGSMIPWHPVNGRPAYKCSTHSRKGRAACTTGSITHVAVDAAADAVMVRHLGDPGRIAALLEAALLGPDMQRADFDREQSAKQLDALRAERKRVLTSFERGLRTLTESEDRCREIDLQVDLLAAMAERTTPPPESDPQALAQRLCEPFSEWPHLSSLKQKRKILRASVEAVHVRRTGVAKAAVDAVDLTLPLALSSHQG